MWLFIELNTAFLVPKADNAKFVSYVLMLEDYGTHYTIKI